MKEEKPWSFFMLAPSESQRAINQGRALLTQRKSLSREWRPMDNRFSDETQLTVRRLIYSCFYQHPVLYFPSSKKEKFHPRTLKIVYVLVLQGVINVVLLVWRGWEGGWSRDTWLFLKKRVLGTTCVLSVACPVLLQMPKLVSLPSLGIYFMI